MNRRQLTRNASLALAAAALFGCATANPTQVTRFHLGQPIARGAITLEPLDPRANGSLEYKADEDAVAAQLVKLGFTVQPGLRTSEQVAVVDVQRAVRPSYGGGSRFSIGLGGGSFGRGGGVGGGVQVPVGKPRSNEVAQTTLHVMLKRRSDGSTVWEGRAVSEARTGTAADAPGPLVQRLATALFADFPGVSGRTVSVK